MRIQLDRTRVRRFRHLRQARARVLLARRLGVRVADRGRRRPGGGPRTPSCARCWTARCTPSSRWASTGRRATHQRTVPTRRRSRTSKPKATKRSRDSSDDPTTATSSPPRTSSSGPRVPTANCASRSARAAQALIHPPQPICRYCRSHNMGVRGVSGAATLAAFTVNHRFGFPDLPPPYVVAQVAIAEDPRVRLTTNIIDCDPDELDARASPSRCCSSSHRGRRGCRCSRRRPRRDADRTADRRDRAAGLRASTSGRC